MSRLQVQANHYDNLRYLSKQRLASYWHQLDEIVQINPSRMLEIGVGSGFMRQQLMVLGMRNIISVDIDLALSPDVLADVMHLPFQDGYVDVAMAFQVLEHMPYSGFEAALQELWRVSKKHVLISLPDRTPTIRWWFSISQWQLRPKIIRVPLVLNRALSTTEHYWEIGLKGYPLSRIQASIHAAKFNIRKTYQVREYPYHRFFILEKSWGVP